MICSSADGGLKRARGERDTLASSGVQHQAIESVVDAPSSKRAKLEEDIDVERSKEGDMKEERKGEDRDGGRGECGRGSGRGRGRGPGRGKGRMKAGRGRYRDKGGDGAGRGEVDERDNKNRGEAKQNRDTGTLESRDKEESEEGKTRLPKRKVALYFGYCGTGYSGLQVNHGVRTIEGDIFGALCKAGAVSKDNSTDPTKVNLQRAARTDAGVHAAGNLLTLKMIVNVPGISDLVAHLNSLLPDQIRIWGFTRVQNGFNARMSCDSRMYEYLLPTYVFIPPKPGTCMDLTVRRMAAGSKPSSSANAAAKPETGLLNDPSVHPFWKEQGLDGSFKEDVAAKKRWRIDAETLERVRKTFAEYEGAHNFYNFTVGKSFRDRSAQRFMKKLVVSDPQVIDGIEWISIKLHGQAFMLHQIRKMIGLLVLVCRTGTPHTLIPETYGPSRIHVPKAPGLGLLLEEPFFGNYNKRIAENNAKIDAKLERKRRDKATAAGHADGKEQQQPVLEESNKDKADRSAEEEASKREPILYDAFQEKMETFKQAHIYDKIVAEENANDEFAKWLNYLEVYTGPDFDYLNPKGIIPDSSVLKPGEERSRIKDQFAGALDGMDGKGSSDKQAGAGEGEVLKDEVEVAGGRVTAGEVLPESDDEEEVPNRGNEAENEG